MLAAACGATLLYLFDPVVDDKYFPKCPSFWLFGVYCPGCGITRALHQLLHGHLLAALAYNSLAILAAPVLVWMAFKPRWIYHPTTPKVAFFLLLAYGLMRNIPYYPFLLLAPHVT